MKTNAPNEPRRRRLATVLPACVFGAAVVFAPALGLAADTGAAIAAQGQAARQAMLAQACNPALWAAAASDSLAQVINDQGRQAGETMLARVQDPAQWAQAARDGLARALGLPVITDPIVSAGIPGSIRD